MRRVYQQNETQSTFDQAAAVADRQANAEIGIIPILLANRLRGLAILKAAGVNHLHFNQPDLRLIFLAVEARPTGPLLETIKLIQSLLGLENLWREDVPAADRRSMYWSSAKLAAFATERLYSRDDTADLAELAVLAVELATLNLKGVAA